MSTSAIVAILAILLTTATMFWSRNKWQPEGKYCVVTGGSSGLGLALATLLVKRGAHVAIIARDSEKLNEALQILQAVRVNESQHISAHSHSLDTLEQSKAALTEAFPNSRAPDALFTCAGSSTPGYFLPMSESDLRSGMHDAYWIQVLPAMAGAKMMALQGIQGRIVFVGSTISYMSFPGYANYAPAKHALVGLVETLRSELALYDITVQLFTPCTMYTKGYEHENRTKPSITKKIEETDGGLTAEQGAQALFRGVQKNYAHFAGDLITNLFRVSTRGSTPNHNVIVDFFLYLIAWPGVPIWRYTVERHVRNAKSAHLEEMRELGLVKSD